MTELIVEALWHVLLRVNALLYDCSILCSKNRRCKLTICTIHVTSVTLRRIEVSKKVPGTLFLKNSPAPAEKVLYCPPAQQY
jgi:hypothetical protein